MSLHYLAFRALIHATESEEKVLEAMRFVTGKGELAATKTHGHYGNPITIIEGEIRREREISEFFRRMDERTNREIISSLEFRVDDECHLFFRLDKQAAYQGMIILAEREDFIQVRGKIKCYPRNRDNAIVSIREYLGSFLSNHSRSG